VDLLLSLPFVDKENIGATGASGGGNQTMWFAALDERIKAAMPIVSVGTFESAVMGSNCVCELMPGGLTFTESRSEEHTSELQSRENLVCRLLLEKKKKKKKGEKKEDRTDDRDDN